MKLVTVIACSLFITACGDITRAQLDLAQEMCRERGGIRTIIQHTIKKNVVMCMDDTYKFIQE